MMRRIWGTKTGVILFASLAMGAGVASADLSGISIQSVTLRNNGYLREGAQPGANVGVIRSQSLSFFRTAYLVTIPSGDLDSNLSFSLQVLESHFTDLAGAPLTDLSGVPIAGLTSPINISIIKADPSLGFDDPVQALLEILNPQNATESDLSYDYDAVFDAKVFPNSTNSKSVDPNTRDQTSIPFTVTSGQLGTEGVVETINGTSYLALMVQQDSSYSYAFGPPGGFKATSVVALSLQSVPEPASLSLVGGGLLLGGGSWVRSRRGRNRVRP